MSNDAAIEQLIQDIHSIRPGWGMDKLRKILTSGTAAQQQAALQAAQATITNGQVPASMGDVEDAAQQAVGQTSNDPVSRLSKEAHVGLFPWDTHTSWSSSQLQQLRDYFKGDQLLKNDVAAQNKIVDQLQQTVGSGDPVQAAKGIHWGMLSPDQKAKYGYQSGDIKNLDELKKHVSGNNVDWSGLDKYLKPLSGDQKYIALQQINQEIGGSGPLGAYKFVDQKAVDQLVRKLTTQPGAKSSASTQVPASGVDPSQNLFTVTPGATDPHPDQIKQWEGVTGQKFEDAYKNFVNSQYVSVQQQTAQGVLTGNEQLWSNGKYTPIDPSQNSQGLQYVFTAHSKDQALTPQEQAQSKGKNLQVSKAQFLGMMTSSNQAATSKMALIQATENAITTKYGITLSDPEKQQIYSKISTMSMQQLGQQVTTGGGGAIGWATNAIGSAGIFGNLVASFPEVSGGVAQASAISALQAALGADYAKYVSQDQITQLSKMSQADQTQYIDNLPDPTHPGYTVKAWNTGYGQILSDWQTNFGFSSKPSDSQISALMGMNTTQRTDYFNNSPSPVKGMNNLTYKNYDTTINNIRGDLTPSMGADFMASLAKPPKTPVP
jgi:hypothetical protein